jgi:uncharacterized membrane protein YeaQ/YmgE (transglycosylase-associated protein family)
MNEMSVTTSALNVIMTIVLSVGIIVGGFIFSKLSKSSEQVKKTVSMGLYLVGVVNLLVNRSDIWQVINGTYEPRDINFAVNDGSAGVYVGDWLIPTIGVFGMDINILYLISIAIGLLISVVGLRYKKKNWSKLVLLMGGAAIVLPLFQIFT